MASSSPLVEQSTDTIDKKPVVVQEKVPDPAIKKWKLGCLALLIISFILLVVVIALAAKKQKIHMKTCPKSPGQKNPVITDEFKQDTKISSDNPSVFQDMTAEELNNVRDFMLGRKELALTPYKNASLSSNFILAIDLLLPTKNDVLSYLNDKGVKPRRQARVTILNGGSAKPSIKEFIVETLPHPSSYKVFQRLKYKGDVPFSKRPIANVELVEAEKFLGMILMQNKYLAVIINESFDGHFVHKSHKLIMNPGGLGVDTTGNRRVSWIGLRRQVQGWNLHNLPLELLIDHTEPNFFHWRVTKVYYNQQYFDSITEFVSRYQKGTVNKIKIPWPSDADILKGSMQRRGTETFRFPMLGPTLVEPNGKRYSVTGRKISYAGWSFEMGSRVFTGPAIYNIKFKSRSVAYEISSQEYLTLYSAHNPQQSASQYIESVVGLGNKYAQLLNGLDCPQTSTYIDFDIYFDSPSAKTLKNAFCVFEMNEPVPSRRHSDIASGKRYFVGGHPDYALYVRSVVVVGNYDYIVDFIFHQSGVLEVKTSATGYLATNYFYPSENDFGYQNFPSTASTIHDHIILYKVDLDIDGVQNSFQTLSIQPKKHTPVWNKTINLLQKHVVKDIKNTEMKASVKYNFDKPTYYTMINKNVMNTYGNPVGYRIVPMSMVKQVYPQDYFVTKAAAWSQYQIAVTKHKDEESEGSSPFNQFSMANPVVDFATFNQDDENISNEDLVAWISVGTLHIPNTEDIPNTITTSGSFSFSLKPYGFFNLDPTMGSRESVMLLAGQMVDNGLPTLAACPSINRTLA